MTTFGRIQWRRDDGASWSSVNPILLNGEVGFNATNGLFKIGDGETPWNALTYYGAGNAFSALLVWDAITSKPAYIGAGTTAAAARAAIGAAGADDLAQELSDLIGAAPEYADTLKELHDLIVEGDADLTDLMTLVGTKQAKFMTGTVGTAVGTAAKTVTLDSPWASHTLAAGDWLLITFANGTNVSTPSLAVNGGAASFIQTPGGQSTAYDINIATGRSLLLYFDGSRFIAQGTTYGYSEISEADIIDTGHAVLRMVTGRRAEYLMANEAAKARTLLLKTLGNPTITNFTETAQAISNSGTTKTFNLATGTIIPITMTGNCTFTMPAVGEGKSFMARIYTGTGGFTGTFTGVKWPAGTAPTLTPTASRMDLVSFVSDGTNWYGSIAQNYTP